MLTPWLIKLNVYYSDLDHMKGHYKKITQTLLQNLYSEDINSVLGSARSMRSFASLRKRDTDNTIRGTCDRMLAHDSSGMLS